MKEVVYIFVSAVVLLGAGMLIRRAHRRRLSLERIQGDAESVNRLSRLDEVGPLIAERPLVSVVIGLVAVALLWLVVGWPLSFALSVGFLVGIVAHLALGWYTRAQISKIEAQLADAVDLIVSAVRAGTGLVDALELAAVEIRQPLRGELEDIVTQLRLGADPRRTLATLERRVPLETMQLFMFSLSVHWQSGSSLAGSLMSVSTTIRDRIAVGRRMRAQSTEAQVSALGVLTVTYLLALVSWRAEPARFVGFLGSSIGAFLVNATIVLQAVGFLWMTRLTRVEV